MKTPYRVGVALEAWASGVRSHAGPPDVTVFELARDLFVAGGDRGAFAAALAEDNYRLVGWATSLWLRRHPEQGHEADDVYDECVTTYWGCCRHYDPLLGYALSTLVKFSCWRRLARAAAARARRSDLVRLVPLETRHDYLTAPAARQESWRLADLCDFLATLPPAVRRTVVRRHFDGAAIRDIAAEFRVSKDTVRSRLARFMRSARKHFLGEVPQ